MDYIHIKELLRLRPYTISKKYNLFLAFNKITLQTVPFSKHARGFQRCKQSKMLFG